MSFAPLAAASFASFTISEVLYAQSAACRSGVAAAILINPSRIGDAPSSGIVQIELVYLFLYLCARAAVPDTGIKRVPIVWNWRAEGSPPYDPSAHCVSAGASNARPGNVESHESWAHTVRPYDITSANHTQSVLQNDEMENETISFSIFPLLTDPQPESQTHPFHPDASDNALSLPRSRRRAAAQRSGSGWP